MSSGSVTLPQTGGGSGGVTSINGDTTPAQLIVGGTGIAVTSLGGTTTIAATGGSGTVTSVDVSGGATGLTTSGGPITTAGTITLAGLLNIASGGTNSATTLNNNRVMQSSGGAIVEAAAITGSRALASDTNGIPVASTTTATELGFVNGVTSSIQTQLNAKQASGNYITALTGDVTATGPGSATATIPVGTVTDAKGALAIKPACTVAATTNQALTGTPTIDGIATASGSLILLTAQSTGSQNGPWVAAAGAWSRPTWYASGNTSQAFQFITTFIRLGTVYAGSTWRQTAAGPITIDTTATTWIVVAAALNASTVAGNPFPSKVSFSLPGPRVVQTDCTNWFIMPNAGTIAKAWIIAKTGPTGSAFIIDLLKSTNNGSSFTSIWAVTPANKLQIAAAAVAGNQTSFDTTTFSAGDVFRIDISQVGSTIAGSDITVIMGILINNT